MKINPELVPKSLKTKTSKKCHINKKCKYLNINFLYLDSIIFH
jgi:hypothetical protein